MHGAYQGRWQKGVVNRAAARYSGSQGRPRGSVDQKGKERWREKQEEAGEQERRARDMKE